MAQSATPRQVFLELTASKNWRETCRQAIEVADQFPGTLVFAIRVPAQHLEMEFPNHRVAYSPELVRALEQLAGVMEVGTVAQ